MPSRCPTRTPAGFPFAIKQRLSHTYIKLYVIMDSLKQIISITIEGCLYEHLPYLTKTVITPRINKMATFISKAYCINIGLQHKLEKENFSTLSLVQSQNIATNLNRTIEVSSINSFSITRGLKLSFSNYMQMDAFPLKC